MTDSPRHQVPVRRAPHRRTVREIRDDLWDPGLELEVLAHRREEHRG